MINWDATKEETLAIHKIAKRYAHMMANHGHVIDLMTVDMDLTAAHLTGCKLDLTKLAAFDDANFAHDVAGIQHHINRETGELADCFLPRCAA